MERRSGVKIAAGLFVFGGLVLLAASIFVLGQRGRYFTPQHTLGAEFTDVAGLHEGAPVRLAGVAVGRVTRISLPRPPARKVGVELSIADPAMESIRRDSVARVQTIGFLGDKFVEITVGSLEEPRLADGASLRVDESADFTALVGQGRRVLGHTERLTAALAEGEGALPWLINDPESRRLVRDALDSVRAATASLEQGRGALPWLVSDPESKRLVRETLGSVHTMAVAVEKGPGALGWLARDPESKRLLAETLESIRAVTASVQHGDGAVSWLLGDPESRRLVQDIGRTATVLAALAQEVKEGRGLAHALIYDPQGGEMLTEAAETLRDLRSLVAAVREGEGALPALLFDPESRQLLDNLTSASRNLEEVSGKVARGEGTIGALLADPTVYEDLTALLEGARRSWLLRWTIRHTLNAGRAGADRGAESQRHQEPRRP